MHDDDERVSRLLPLSAVTLGILLALADADLHGYAILKEVEQQAQPPRALGTGTLYAALQRLGADGLVEDSPVLPAPDEDQRRRYYRITALGRAVARAELTRLARLLEVARSKSLMEPGLPRLAGEAT
jgi:DNA-binding PadR family transcriptional regulator